MISIVHEQKTSQPQVGDTNKFEAEEKRANDKKSEVEILRLIRRDRLRRKTIGFYQRLVL